MSFLSGKRCTYPREHMLNFNRYTEKTKAQLRNNYLLNKSPNFSVTEFLGHSCQHIRDSGRSKGDGEYWIDPEKNGNPLKVYCDMTNAGGT